MLPDPVPRRRHRAPSRRTRPRTRPGSRRATRPAASCSSICWRICWASGAGESATERSLQIGQCSPARSAAPAGAWTPAAGARGPRRVRASPRPRSRRARRPARRPTSAPLTGAALEQRLDRAREPVGVDPADDPVDDPPGPVDEEGLRYAADAVRQRGLGVLVLDHRVGQPGLVHVVLGPVAGVLEVDAEQDHPGVAVALPGLVERVLLLVALGAPGRPEVHHDDLAAQLGQGHRRPVDPAEGEVGRGPADQRRGGGRRVPAESGGEHRDDGEHGHDDGPEQQQAAAHSDHPRAGELRGAARPRRSPPRPGGGAPARRPRRRRAPSPRRRSTAR